MYITYKDEQSIADKGKYVKDNGLGGAIVWTLNQGYYNSQSTLLAALATLSCSSQFKGIWCFDFTLRHID